MRKQYVCDYVFTVMIIKTHSKVTSTASAESYQTRTLEFEMTYRCMNKAHTRVYQLVGRSGLGDGKTYLYKLQIR